MTVDWYGCTAWSAIVYMYLTSGQDLSTFMSSITEVSEYIEHYIFPMPWFIHDNNNKTFEKKETNPPPPQKKKGKNQII